MKKKTTLEEIIQASVKKFVNEALKEGPNDQADGESDSEAGEQAKKLNLAPKPFGNYADPQSGDVVAKSVQGHLVKLDPKDNNPDNLAGDPLSGNKPEKSIVGNAPEPSSKLKDMTPKKNSAMNPPMKTAAGWKASRKGEAQPRWTDKKPEHPQDHEAIPADKAAAQAKLPKDTEPGYDPYADDAKTTLKNQKPQKEPPANKAAATLMSKIKDVGKAKLWAAAKMATYQKAGDAKNAIFFGEILKSLAKAEKTVEIPQDVKDTVRDTTAFSRAANPTSDMNAKIDKGMDDMNNEPSSKLSSMVPPIKQQFADYAKSLGDPNAEQYYMKSLEGMDDDEAAEWLDKVKRDAENGPDDLKNHG